MSASSSSSSHNNHAAEHEMSATLSLPAPAVLSTTTENLKEEEWQEERLSADLALFLSNPSLKAALADGSLDLASYSSTVEQELQDLESQCIGVYRSKGQEIASLRTELESCDAILGALQEMLLGFQADLGGLSGDIRNLQEKSRTLGIQLRNRRKAEEGLRHYLEHIVIAPALTNAICRGPVNSTFLESVHELNTIYEDVHGTEPQSWSCDKVPSQTRAGQEMQDHVRKLRLVAVSRTRDYFLAQMQLLRKPNTNVRMIQVHGLLKYADLQDFLYEASPEIASEVFNVYMESMGKSLYALFRTYQAQLHQLDATKMAATRHDVIAIDDSALRDALTTKAKKRVDSFGLGTRAHDVLEDAAEPLMSHLALAEGKRYPYEMLFRSLMIHLINAVTNEHVFCRKFFKRDAFGPLFQSTLSLLLEQLENYLFSCHDALALLLMIKVTHAHRRLLKSRNVHSLNTFLDQVTHLLWPRLKMVIDAHLRSIRSANAQKLGGVDLHAHYVSRRYAEFTCSILSILQIKVGGGGSAAAAAANTLDSTTTTPRKSPSSGSLKSQKSGGGGSKGPPTLAEAKSESATVSPRTPATAYSKSSLERHKSDGAASTNLPRTPSADLGVVGSSTHSGSTPGSADGSSHRGSAGDMLLRDIALIMEETVLLLERLADEHGSSNKKRTVFLINNLDQIICIFQERRVVGKELNKFIELLMAQRERFVEEELLQNFSKLIAFVQQTETHMVTSSAPVDVNAHVVENLVREFSSSWKQGIEQINRNVLSYFSNFRNGMEILKQVLTQLLLYYTRFQDIIRKVWRSKPPAFCKDLVSTTVILAEIKKYALAI